MPQGYSLNAELEEHLRWWGLRRFDSDAAYFAWQRQAFSTEDIRRLTELAQRKNLTVENEIAFYDFSAAPHILPVLYSQRYDYYLTVGRVISARLQPAGAILDVGCGAGILTTFYARQTPGVSVIGLDRSPDSIRAAQERASALGVHNVRFVCGDMREAGRLGPYDLIVATHVVLQAEQDPGLPSESCRTFLRPADEVAQSVFEARTGVGPRLDALRDLLNPDGRLLLFEKARLLARRIPFQRAIQRRGFRLIEPALPLRYRLVEEVADDGPLYHCGRRVAAPARWDEQPEMAMDDPLFRLAGPAVEPLLARLPERAVTLRAAWSDPELGTLEAESGLAGRTLAYLAVRHEGAWRAVIGPQGGAVEEMGHDLTVIRTLCTTPWPPPTAAHEASNLPLYEHHGPRAQEMWTRWLARQPRASRSFAQPGSREVYVEWGDLAPFAYLYWANTFDQRQVVLVEQSRRRMVQDYYDELVQAGETGTAADESAQAVPLTSPPMTT